MSDDSEQADASDQNASASREEKPDRQAADGEHVEEAPSSDEQTSPAPAAEDASQDEDPFAQLETSEGDDPFAELDPETTPAADALFTEMDAAAPPEETDVFDLLQSDQTGSVVPDAPSGQPTAESPDGVDETGADAVIPKHRYCERCPHFSTPPTVACSHEGTSILELVDSEHVRVRNCPVVAERRELHGDAE